MITNKALSMMKTRTRQTAGPYYCEADKEYWQERNKNYVARKKVVLVKKTTYFNNVKEALYPSTWQFDKRETTHDTSEWEMSNIMLNVTGSSLRKHSGTHAIDWCSTHGVSSHLLAYNHETVMTVECNPECMTMAKTNIKNLNVVNKDVDKHSFKELQCDIHNAHIVANTIDWSVYDTVRLGSSSAPRIYNAIKSQLTNCKLLFVSNCSISFQQTLIADGFKHHTNLKAHDYFAKD
tara:strand:- start:36 stop:743 length:708 start_codon:yes stop_codon:yes gene_type:complete